LIRGGSLKLAWKLISVAKDGKRMLDPSVYAKIILELGKNPDKHVLAEALLDELAEREDLNLSQQDCTAVMKVCIKLGKFEAVESLFNWFRQSGHEPSVVMYTTLIHSRYSESKYREALAVVWEMEGSDCLFDLTAYRVVIKLFVALNDLPRAVRYFSKLKEAGLSPTYTGT
jgi:pentatricopeptide repeat protein